MNSAINRSFSQPGRLAILGIMLLCTHPVFAQSADEAGVAEGNAWRFNVYLDDKEIGYHHFFVAEYGDTRQLRSVASFDYKLLFVSLFQYDHENLEIWNGDCLQSIESRTDSNGDVFNVAGRREPGEFRVAGNGVQASLPECVMSFAYWNPAFLQQGSLLNTQNGEYLEVEISEPVFEELEVQGELRPSFRYRLAAGELKLDLWYSTRNEWLALESDVKGGRKLRYELDVLPTADQGLAWQGAASGVVRGQGGSGAGQ